MRIATNDLLQGVRTDAGTDRKRARTFFLLIIAALVAAFAFSGAALAAVDEGATPPSISSDKADYAPGELVTLRGSNWRAGETVTIDVNDDESQSWRRNVEVVADADGNITDTFNLPDWFIAVYTVTATGPQSGAAVMSFTDGNIKVKSDGIRHFTFTVQPFSSSSNCTTGGGAISTSNLADTNGNGQSSNAGQSLLITANTNANAPSGTATFVSWSNPDGLTIIPNLTSRTICVSGFASGSKDLIGNYTAPPANTAPVANNDSYSVNEDAVLSQAAPGVLGNDTDADSNPLTAVLVTGTNNGALTLNANGSFTYTPNANYFGSDSFSYRANDGSANSNLAAVALTINPVNDAPSFTKGPDKTVAEDAGAQTFSGWATSISSGPANESAQTLTFNVSSNNNDLFSAQPAVAPNGTLTFTPAANANGSATVTVSLSDSGGTANGGVDTSAAQTFTITVNAANDAPTCSAGSETTPEDTPKSLTLVCADADGNSLTYSIVSGPTHGGLTGSSAYSSDLNYHGSDSFTFKANDGTIDSNVATFSLTITPVNDAPACSAGSETTAEDTPKSLTLVCADVDGNSLTYSIVSGPTHGGLTGSGASRTYSSDLNYHGSDSFTFQANDGTIDSNVATFSLTITPVNDAPVCEDVSITTAEDVAGLTDPSCSDVDGDTLSYEIVAQPAHGTAAVTLTNKLKYTPNANYYGSDSFTYKANDGTADSNTADVDVTVTAVNDAPVCEDVSITTNEDVAGMSDPDCSDVDADTLSYEIVAQPAHGTAAVTLTNKLKYTPNANYNGSDSFTYKANDGTADSNTADVDVTVTAVNDVPVAADDSYATTEDTTLNVAAPGVLINDTDVENDTLTAVLVADVTHGTLTLNADGSFDYEPDLNFNGSDSFTYKANDGTDDSNIATVSITVNAVNDAPVAVDDDYSTDEDTTLSIGAPGVLINDTDVENDTLTAVLVTDVTHGTLTLNADGSFDYEPDLNFNGRDSFTYKANDGTADSNVVTVSITVDPVNDAPVCVEVSITTDEDTAGSTDPACSDVDGDTLSYEIVAQPANGDATVNLAGELEYTPDQDFNGSDSFTYKANDGIADSNVANVDVTVNAVNDAPFNFVPGAQSLPEDGTLTFSSATFNGLSTSDVDAGTADVQATVTVTQGTFTLGGTAGLSFLAGDGTADGLMTFEGTVDEVNDALAGSSYTPAANYFGPASLTLTVNDKENTGSGGPLSDSDSVAIEVTAVNDAPVAVDDSYSTDEDTTLNEAAPGVPGNDTDVENDPLTAALVAGPSHGSVTLNANGSFSYTPAANYNGTDSFTYRANDGAANSNVATVSITVNAVNDAPVAVNDAFSTNEDTTLNEAAPGVLTNDTDVDGDGLTAVLVDDVDHGTLTLNADGSFDYEPNANYNGSDSFTYKANDGALDSNVATVSITVHAVNDAPVAVDDSYSTDEDTTLNVATPGVLGNDTDVENDTLTALLVAGPSHGSMSLNANGGFTYTPPANYNGPDSFTYKANDGVANSNLATVAITVTAVNDAPVAADNSYATDEDTALTVPAPGVLANDNDIDGDALTTELVADVAHGTLSLNANGSFSYTPAANYNGPDSFTYRANDGAANSNVATVSITVRPVNDAPVADNDAYSIDEDNTLTVPTPGVLDGDTDIENDSLSAVLVAGPSHGALVLSGNGSLSYTPAANYNGPDSFTYKANDGTADSNVATVWITVRPVNDAPVAANDSYSTDEDTTLTVAVPGVLSNDSDVDGDTLTVTKTGGPSHGTATLNSNGSFTYTPAANYNGPDSFTYRANDSAADSNVATVSITVRPVNDAPTVNATNATVTVNEGQTAGNTGTWADIDLDAVTVGASIGTVVTSTSGTWSWSFATSDSDQSQTVTITANDGKGGTAQTTLSLVVNNLNPSVTITSPPYGTLYPMNSTVVLTAGFTDAGTGDTHTCTIDWDNGAPVAGAVTESNGAGTCSGSKQLSAAGVYTIKVKVTDDDGGYGEAEVLVVVYDPSAGFVTGGGWIISPAGAYRPDLTLTGKANFGFVSKYQKGQSVPTGQTEFQFQTGNVNFHSESYQWLVVTANVTKAQFKGTGALNGVSGYGFLLTASDGNPDKFRIKIWTSDGSVVYDNNFGASDDIDAAAPMAIAGGSIVIHK